MLLGFHTETVEQYIDSRRSTLWGRAYNVVEPDGRQAAIEWLTSTLEELAEIDRQVTADLSTVVNGNTCHGAEDDEQATMQS